MPEQRVGASIALRKSYKDSKDVFWTAEVRLWSEEGTEPGAASYARKSEELEERVAARTLQTAAELWEALAPGGDIHE